MRALCSILHLNRKELPSLDDIDELWLGDFVQLAQKYDLCSVAAFQGQCWLRIFTHERLAAVTNQDESEPVEHTSDDNEQHPEREPDLMQILKALVEAAYAFEDADGFEEATKLVILHQNHARYSIYGIENCFSESVILPSIVVDDLGMQLERNVEKVIDLIKSRMMSLASRYRAGYYKANGKKQHGGYGSSDFHKVNYITGVHDALASQEFTEQIIAAELWPSVDGIGKRIFSEHLIQLHRFVDLPGGLYQDVPWSTTAPSVGCKACATSISAHARELADEILGGIEGLCMACLKREVC